MNATIDISPTLASTYCPGFEAGWVTTFADRAREQGRPFLWFNSAVWVVLADGVIVTDLTVRNLDPVLVDEFKAEAERDWQEKHRIR